MKTLLRTFLVLPLLVACSSGDPPVEEADLSMSEPADMSAPVDQAALDAEASDMTSAPDQFTQADMTVATKSFTWAEVIGWWAADITHGPICAESNLSDILRAFCLDKKYLGYKMGCDENDRSNLIIICAGK